MNNLQVQEGTHTLLATADLTVYNEVSISEIKLIFRKKQLFLSMPTRRKGNKYVEVVQLSEKLHREVEREFVAQYYKMNGKADQSL
ncbi:MAG: septation protein SpoVG family protein [Pygmaiobacter massiliensis]|nr:septation protein SpoVG family protein [Pygmaiobacter massiliensis]